jgi:carbonic anhydrase
VLAELAEQGKVLVVGAIYDIKTGKVDFSNQSSARHTVSLRP